MSEPEPADLPGRMGATPTVEGISAVIPASRDMARTVRFDRALGLVGRHDGERASFTSLHAGPAT